MAAYQGAIDYLDRRRLGDRNRVGLLGFSRTVYYVEYTLTHSQYPFTVASLADGDLRVNPIPESLRGEPSAGADDEVPLMQSTTTAQIAGVPFENKTQRRCVGLSWIF